MPATTCSVVDLLRGISPVQRNGRLVAGFRKIWSTQTQQNEYIQQNPHKHNGFWTCSDDREKQSLPTYLIKNALALDNILAKSMCFLSNLTELSCISAGYSQWCTSFLLIFVETHAQNNQHLLISIRRIVNAVSGWNLHLNSEPPFFWFAFLVWRPRCSHTSCLYDALRAFILTALAWRWENHNACNTLNNSFQQIATPTYSLLLLLFEASSRLVAL